MGQACPVHQSFGVATEKRRRRVTTENNFASLSSGVKSHMRPTRTTAPSLIACTSKRATLAHDVQMVHHQRSAGGYVLQTLSFGDGDTTAGQILRIGP